MNLATWWPQATPGTTYVRCQIPARHLPGKLEDLTTRSLVPDENGDPFLVGQEGYASIWQFPGNATRGLMMAQAQEQGHKVMIEVDDNYLKPPPSIPGLRGDWQGKLDRTVYDKHSYAAHRKLAQWVDGVIVSTPTLVEVYERATSAPVFLCPNAVDPADWDGTYPENDGPLRIGYAGSPSHMYDFALIDRALDWASRAGLSLYKFGLKNTTWRWEHTEAPWTNTLSDYRKSLRVLDIGLCPLKRGEWHDCKSDLKAMEYTMAGVLPIVQADSPAYADWVDVVPSASTEKQWEKVVKEIGSMDRAEIFMLWTDALKFVYEHKTIDRLIGNWREAVA